MNPWLITWEPMGEREERTIKNRIAAILPNRTGEGNVIRAMYLLYANYSACSGLSDYIYVSEQLRFARWQFPYKAVRYLFPEIHLGGNPFLYARPVRNLKIVEDEDGYQVVRWEEIIFPTIDTSKNVDEQVRAARPFKRRRMAYLTRTNTIVPDGP
jgi:hypothetical protein